VVELNARKGKELNVLQRESRVEEPTKLKQEAIEKLDRSNGVPRPFLDTTDPPAPLQPPVRRE